MNSIPGAILAFSSRISEVKRITLLLAAVEGLSCAEIAEALGVPIGTVWTRLHAARHELRPGERRRGMTPAPCPRLFEVEAARDGRLTGAELASFERHLASCRACLREAKALESLADALRASPRDAGGEDALHVRRERIRLLAAFDRALVTPEPRSGAWRRLRGSAAVAALVAVVAGVFVLRRVRTGEPPVHASAVVHADSAAEWSERMNDNRETIVLQRGALWIHVDHSSNESRVLVVLPDGELEDTGTTFTVTAAEGQTTRVAVHEGSVVLRLRGLPPVAIGGGDTWIPEARPPAGALASAAPPVAAIERSGEHEQPATCTRGSPSRCTSR